MLDVVRRMKANGIVFCCVPSLVFAALTALGEPVDWEGAELQALPLGFAESRHCFVGKRSSMKRWNCLAERKNETAFQIAQGESIRGIILCNGGYT